MREHYHSAYWIIFETIILVIVWACLSTLSYGETEVVTINTDKTYEQCEREAFERLYKQVNRQLNDMVDDITANKNKNETIEDYVLRKATSIVEAREEEIRENINREKQRK